MAEPTPLFEDTDIVVDMADPDPRDIAVVTAGEFFATAEHLPEKVVAVPALGPGRGVKIRALTKGQQLAVRRRSTNRHDGSIDADRLELLLVHEGVIEPKFSREQLEQLQTVAWGTVDTIATEVMRISGMLKEQEDNAARRFRNG